MKRLLIIMVWAFFSSLAGSPPAKKDNTINIKTGIVIRPYERLWKAVCLVESNNNPLAYNHKEKACGIAQIRPIRLKHYNNLTGKHYTTKDCFDPIKSKEIFLYFARQYGENDLKTIAMRWNGKGKKAEQYWMKVKKHLETSPKQK